MFGEQGFEALVLGARWVKGQGDPALAQAADSALAKIVTASPPDLRDKLAQTGLWVPRCSAAAPMPDLHVVREATRRERKLSILYVDTAGGQTRRTIWPLVLAYFEGACLIGALRIARGLPTLLGRPDRAPRGDGLPIAAPPACAREGLPMRAEAPRAGLRGTRRRGGC